MKKEIAIITLYGNYNFGNKLQNYALQEYLKRKNLSVKTFINYPYRNKKDFYYLRVLKYYIYNKKKEKKWPNERMENFKLFNRNIDYYDKVITVKNIKQTNFDFYIVGSDQVWNPIYGGLSDIDLLTDIDPRKRISYAASFGIDYLPDNKREKAKIELSRFNKISVREEVGKKIIEDITNRRDIEVMIDPTLLLSGQEWQMIENKPKNFDNKKYILNYFLGGLDDNILEEIKRVAKMYDCEIIDILNPNDKYYNVGPAEFLFLERNAFLICTDSFHSSVFAFIFNRPFIVFKRKQNGSKNLYSRIDTLLKKFDLLDRSFKGNTITNNYLKTDYKKAYRLLEEERKKSDIFINEALGIKDCD